VLRKLPARSRPAWILRLLHGDRGAFATHCFLKTSVRSFMSFGADVVLLTACGVFLVPVSAMPVSMPRLVATTRHGESLKVRADVPRTVTSALLSPQYGNRNES
jgi:hypothetical protein